ncbi:MAG: type ISP restriction/modification enzyme [candidate division WOR-3 bacterium]
MERFIKRYLDGISDITKRGDAREESYYPVLKELVEEVARFYGKNVHITILPKKTEAGNPDFRVWDSSHNVTGYIEAKTPGINLDNVITTEQLKRYLNTFPNLILTDFYEFRLYRNGQEIQRVLLARPFIPQKIKVKPPAEGVEGLKRLFHNFLDFAIPPISTAEALARELAHKTRFLRDEVILPELKDGKSDIYGFYEAFKEYLLPSLTEEQFADLYAQTIAYGLFSARTRTENNFNRKIAYALIPSTIGILRDVFHYISLGQVSQQMEVMVDDIAALLNAVDVRAIMKQYQESGKGDEPIIHFYETFLAEYDPETRERRGVYYTPQPVVSYIVRSVNILLKDRFGLSEGLADERVKLLDPAAGTMTFVAEAIRLAFKEFTEKYGEGVKEKLKRHILQNYYAFELLMAPYAIGHMKIGFLLESLGIPLKEGERFQLYLTNTLEMEELPESRFPGLASLSEESHKAARIKKNEPILVIMGNPPYSGISENINEWTERLLKTDIDGVQSYYKVDGKPLGEKKVWLQDDYVKFLRFAQWKINKTGKGIVAMITNHSYIDNPTFRGMRQSLLKTFDEIYILDLHGNSLKRETTPEGLPDENIFDIRQGVAIGIFVKHGKKELRGIYHLDLYGSREEKYKWLETHDITNAGYKPIKPVKPFYFFVPYSPNRDYQTWPSISEIFPVSSTGIVTARDKLTIHYTPEEVWATVINFVRMNEEDARRFYGLGSDKKGWKVSLAQEDLKYNGGPHRDKIVPVLYRPFDVRYTYYTGRDSGFIWRPRYKVMRHMLAGENVGLCGSRQATVKVFHPPLLPPISLMPMRLQMPYP